MSDSYLSNHLQDPKEHARFIAILKINGVSSYLEIGSMFGGSLWEVARALPPGSRVVSVDYPVDTPRAEPHLRQCVSELSKLGYDSHVVIGDSTARDTVAKAKALGPFDCVFIDGNHTLEGVTADWENYGPMARMVAFHDIAWNATWRSSKPNRAFKAMGVPALWNSLKQNYRHVELKFHPPGNYYGIGILWRC